MIFTELNDAQYAKIMAQSTTLAAPSKLTDLQRLVAYEKRMVEMAGAIREARRQRLLVDNRRRRAVDAVHRSEVNAGWRV
jgi:hypothetical protein